jgi:hypothetical protein
MSAVNLFRDDEGRVAQLHGIGILRSGDTWYAYGESKLNKALFCGVSCYSTRDFAHWHHEGTALRVGDEGSIVGPERIIERPKVMRCPATGRYIMYVHVDGEGDYSYAHIGTAVSDSPSGPFEFLTAMQFRGYESRDIGVFQDEDGTGYILSEDRRHGTHVFRLSDDYLSIVEDVVCLRGENYRFGYESPIMCKRDGIYYWLGSQLTGWDCNDNMYASAARLRGPWSPWRPFAPAGSATFESQCDLVVPLDEDPHHSEHFLYIGDRWHPQDLGGSELLMLPMRIGDGKVDLQWRDRWSLPRPSDGAQWGA